MTVTMLMTLMMRVVTNTRSCSVPGTGVRAHSHPLRYHYDSFSQTRRPGRLLPRLQAGAAGAGTRRGSLRPHGGGCCGMGGGFWGLGEDVKQELSSQTRVPPDL